MSCCPKGSWGALKTDEPLTGRTETVGSVEAYVSGDAGADKALVLFVDIFGIESGRTRQIADWFAAQGYYVVVPDLLEADAMEPSDKLGEQLPAWAKKHGFAAIKPHIAATVAHLKAAGFEKAGCLGFCYGVWAIFHTLADDELKGAFAAAVGAHPSLQLEGFHDGDPEQMGAAVRTPTLLHSCANDKPYVKSDGSVPKSMKENDVTIEVHDVDEQHGFLNRGDCSNATTKAAVQLALERSLTFLDTHVTKK